MTRIAILDDTLRLSQELADWSPLRGRAEIVAFDRHVGPAEAADALAGFDIICTLRERLPFPRTLIERLPSLRHLCVTGKRCDTVDLAAAAAHGVTVSNTPVSGPGAGAVTELTWGLIIASARHIPGESGRMRDGGWQSRAGTTLRGKRLGVVGLGAIGADVARIGLALGMEVVGWSPNLTAAHAAALGVRCVDKHELFATSDVVTLHLALAPATAGVVDGDALRAMKRTAWLVNTARAGLVDEAMLVEALRGHWIAGAALDVYAIEPLPADHVLRSLPNVLLTPHLGYVTRDMLAAYYGYAIENIVAFLDNSPIRLVGSS